jgi:hypothetical protein
VDNSSKPHNNALLYLLEGRCKERQLVLTFGAGTAQIIVDAIDGEFGKVAQTMKMTSETPHQVVARIGIALYNHCGTNCSSDDVSNILQSYRQEYIRALPHQLAAPLYSKIKSRTLAYIGFKYRGLYLRTTMLVGYSLYIPHQLTYTIQVPFSFL